MITDRGDHDEAIEVITIAEIRNEKLKPIGACPGYSIASLFLPWHLIPAPFFDGFRSLPAT